MRKMLTIILLITGVLAIPKIGTAFGRAHSHGIKKNVTFSTVPPALHHPVETLLKFPPALNLLMELTKQGSISLNFSPLGENAANAMWRDDIRQIVINSSKQRGPADFIRSILFEMHNAAAKPHFMQLDQAARGSIMTKEQYVSAVELVEHQNAIQTKKLLQEGIAKGYLPQESSWNILNNFENHYKIQQLSGHSQFIANVYDSLNRQGTKESYHGTLALDALSAAEKAKMIKYLTWKDKLESGTPEEAQAAWNCLATAYSQFTTGNKDKDLSLLKETFYGTTIYDNLFTV